MGLDPIVMVVEAYFNYNPITEQMHLISKMLNASTEVNERLQEKMSFYISNTSKTKINQLLDLLEFLTIFSTSKLSLYINKDKFLEHYMSALMESDLQDKMVNLLKLWHDKYEDNKNDLNHVFELLSNLEIIGIQLPISYKSKYEGIDPKSFFSSEKSNKVDDELQNNVEKVEINAGVKEKVNELISKAKSVREDVDKFVNIKGFRSMALKHQEETENNLRESIASLIKEFDLILNAFPPEMHKFILDVMRDLRKLEEKIQQKLDEAKLEIEFKQPEIGPQLPKNFHKRVSSYNSHQMETEPQYMSIEEFMTYKLERCKEGMQCKHAAADEKNRSGQSNELHCIFWHSSNDRRRIFCGARGDLDYSFTICHAKENCPKADACENAHNFVEAFFHPLNYKKKRCASAGHCSNGKYCPYFHSTEEKELWSNLLAFHLKIKNEREKIETRFDWGEDDDKNTSYPVNVINIGHLQPHIPLHMLGACGIIPLPPSDNNGVRANKQEKVDENPEIPNQKPLLKELHGRLVVRKNYTQPSQLTEFFYKNPCFYGIPLIIEPIRTQDTVSKIQEEEIQKENIVKNQK